MGIREEIEKLRLPPSPKEGWKYWGGENAAINYTIKREGTNNTLNDVLAILDKWECILEKQFGSSTWMECYLSDYGAKPGDHIIIWRRKKNESNS